MRNIAFILVGIFVTTVVFAQSNNTLESLDNEKKVVVAEKNKSNKVRQAEHNEEHGVVTASASKKRLMGPAAKNAKPWKTDGEGNAVVTLTNKKKLNGPKAKNTKPFEIEGKAKPITSTGSKTKLMGPAAKNSKPWKR